MPRRSVTEAAKAREAQNPPSKRILRSNDADEPTAKAEELPPPPEFTGQYFYRNFGVHGVFVGTCIRMVRKGHRNGRDDAFFVRYDDGDVENLCHSDLKRLCRRGPATEAAYLEASKKRTEALARAQQENAVRDAELKAKQAEEAKTAAKQSSVKVESVVSPKPRASNSRPLEGAGPAVITIAEGTDSAATAVVAAAAAAAATAAAAAAKAARKGKRPQMKRKARSSRPSSADDDTVCDPPPEKTLRTGLGWFNHTPCPIMRIESTRLRPTKEYLVRWGLVGQDSTWEPIHHLHAQIVNDYERQLQLQSEMGGVAGGAAEVPVAGAAAVGAPEPPGIQSPSQLSDGQQPAATPIDQGNITTGVPLAGMTALPVPPPATVTPTTIVPCPTDVTTVLATKLAIVHDQYSQLAESYRSVLGYLEPRGWAATSHSVKTLEQSRMHEFPHRDFLKYVEHDLGENRLELEANLQLAEDKRLNAERKAEAAEGKLEEFLAKQTQH